MSAAARHRCTLACDLVPRPQGPANSRRYSRLTVGATLNADRPALPGRL
jgi:hypothetical protein